MADNSTYKLTHTAEELEASIGFGCSPDATPTKDSNKGVKSGGVFQHTSDSNIHIKSSERTKWNGKASTATYNVTIPSFSNSTTVTVTGILATDNPIVDIKLSGSETSEVVELIQNAWSNVYRISTAANSITVYAVGEVTTDIPVQLKVVR